jgi:hypothetical protein
MQIVLSVTVCRMQTFVAAGEFCLGWFAWSLGHNLGHRWWHNDMQKGKKTFYAHGETEHHRIYDGHVQCVFQRAEDPKELFISFPLPIVGAAGLLLIAVYAAMLGPWNAMPFGLGLLGFMVLDHQIHILFHKTPRLGGVLGWFQRMHLIHHATHDSNYFFVSGILWDVLLHTLKTADARAPFAHDKTM